MTAGWMWPPSLNRGPVYMKTYLHGLHVWHKCWMKHTHKNETISFNSIQTHQPWEPFWVWGCCWGQSSAGGTADSASCPPPSGEKQLPPPNYPESTCAYYPSPETHKQHLCMTVDFLQIQNPTGTHCLQSFLKINSKSFLPALHYSILEIHLRLMIYAVVQKFSSEWFFYVFERSINHLYCYFVSM